MGEAFVQVLASSEIPSSVVTVGTSRANVLDAVQRGEVTIAFDWAWSLLEHLSGHRGLAPGDVGATVDVLNRYLGVIGLATLDRTAATRGFVFVTTSSVAETRGIRTLDDVARLSPREGGPGPEAPPVPELLAGSVTTDLGIGASGTEIRRLQERLIGLGIDLGPDIKLTASGNFDEPTRRALAAVQRSVGIAATGVYDAATKRAFDRGLPSGKPERIASGTAGSLDPPTVDAGPPDPTTTTVAASTTTGRGRRPPATTTTIRAGTAGVTHLVFAGGVDGDWTPDVVDLLRQYDAQATFAMTATGVSANPITTKRIKEAGHGLAVTADEHLTFEAPAATEHLIAEVSGNAARIEEVAGARPRCVVPPYGATGEDTVKRAKEAGFDTLLWDIDPQDWRNPSPSAMGDTTIATMRSGDVILLHDGGGNRAQTVTLLRRILDHLKAKGIAARPLCR